MRKLRLIGAGALGLVLTSPALAAPRLDGVVSDHGVLQRDRPLILAGTAEPGETVTVFVGGQSASSAVDRAGRFRLTLAPLRAGGPYQLVVTAKSGMAVVDDLLVGDVYLCSGQSNMELAVAQAQDSFTQIFTSADDQLRLLTVAKATAFKSEAVFDKAPVWDIAGPKTVGSFSAACYYMVRELRQTAKVPIGAIHSSWGGSRIVAWMGEDGLRATGHGADVDMLRLYTRDAGAAIRATSAVWEDWWRSQSGTAKGQEPWQPTAALDWKPVPGLGIFNAWGVPELANYIGMVWYQKAVTLTAAQAAQQAVLSIGTVDDADRTWVNGKPVGGSSIASVQRVYPLAAGTLVAGRNVITVNDDNVYANGGMGGPADVMRITFADGSSVPIADGWTYAIGGKPKGSAPRVPWDDINGLGTIYNAMIAPLGPIALAGVAWYQGESDTDIPGYDARLNAMMRDWRRQFGSSGLPFAIVQLSAFGVPATAPLESGWANLRNVQREVAEADGHAAIAVTLDIGDQIDIHPGEKHEVGRRLARAMRHIVYGEPIPASGPRAAKAARNADGGVTIDFADVTGGLAARGAMQAIGFEICGAAAGSCRYALGRVDGGKVILAGDGQPVTHVRYGWADTPTVNLFDGAGLPVGTFEIAIP